MSSYVELLRPESEDLALDAYLYVGQAQVAKADDWSKNRMAAVSNAVERVASVVGTPSRAPICKARTSAPGVPQLHTRFNG